MSEDFECAFFFTSLLMFAVAVAGVWTWVVLGPAGVTGVFMVVVVALAGALVALSRADARLGQPR